ncbi:hypothetical protein B1750_gp383 [Noumeavirus]|uniref:hypothetical protein n=1 Tax=Noumeavirus TaxID=1955558 RepID=UPI000982ED11|nr:hypothetical protein B1750_gp383 [Noumeavirus]AQM73364.1 hypothetical protein NMV_383 [Noumeavirus]
MSRYIPRLLEFLKVEFQVEEQETIVEIEPRSGCKLVKLCVPKYCVSSSWFETYGTEDVQTQEIESSLESRIYESLYYRRETRRKIAEMKKELEETKFTLNDVSQRLLELEYAPGGQKAEEAKRDFESLLQR